MRGPTLALILALGVTACEAGGAVSGDVWSQADARDSVDSTDTGAATDGASGDSVAADTAVEDAIDDMATDAVVDTAIADTGAADTVAADTGSPVATTFTIPGTGQEHCWGTAPAGIACPAAGGSFSGQDAQYPTTAPRYTVHANGIVTDEVTGLEWQGEVGEKKTFAEAVAGAAGFDLGGYDDWRLPTIKELYSLIDFEGTDPSGCETLEGCAAVPYIDTAAFGFAYGDTAAGERVIDAQWVSSTEYVSTTMNGAATVFGVNFADGRIKGYPKSDPQSGQEKRFFVRYVRGAAGYGEGDFSASGGVVHDAETGLDWLQGDSGSFNVGDDGALTWGEALAWCEGLVWAGRSDWRLPNAKELQALVDYSRSPATTGSAAIAPAFDATPIVDEGGGANYGFYWASTSHLRLGNDGSQAVYVAFGEALGWMTPPTGGDPVLRDVHGAGAQRSDPKLGDVADYPYGNGPQGDVIRIANLARCVRGGASFDSAVGQTPLPLDNGGGQGQGALCEGDDDCLAEGACPPDAGAGCACRATPDGTDRCVPACATTADCPSPPNQTLLCAPAGICVPESGGP